MDSSFSSITYRIRMKNPVSIIPFHFYQLMVHIVELLYEMELSMMVISIIIYISWLQFLFIITARLSASSLIYIGFLFLFYIPSVQSLRQ